jgi:N-methylhydantoinase B
MLYQLHTGDKAIDYTQGGAGVGNPLERDVQAVWADVRDELVSVSSARDDYGVVIDPGTFAVDAPATERLRAERMA